MHACYLIVFPLFSIVHPLAHSLSLAHPFAARSCLVTFSLVVKMWISIYKDENGTKEFENHPNGVEYIVCVVDMDSIKPIFELWIRFIYYKYISKSKGAKKWKVL